MAVVLLDTKDRKIISHLELHGRATFQEIGKQAGISKETAIYRVHRLEERSIIEKYVTLVDFGRLGYTGYAVYCRFENADAQTRRQIIEHLSSIPELYWLALVGGKYDLVYGLMCKSVFQFSKLQYEILGRFGPHLKDGAIAIRTELRHGRRGYLTTKAAEPRFKPPFFGKDPKIEELDETDRLILSALSTDARLPQVAIAKRLGIAVSTAGQRIRSLEQRGIIQGYWTYIRPQRYGMQSYRLLLTLQNMDEKTRSKLFSYAWNNTHMLLAIETVGTWQFEITLEVETHEQLQREITSLREAFPAAIKSAEFIIMFEDDLVYDPYPLLKKERTRQAIRL